MPDNAELIEQYEDELCQLVSRMHKDGIRHEVIRDVFQRMTNCLDTMAYAECWLSQCSPESLNKGYET